MRARIRSQSAGRISSTLEKVADSYRQLYPQREPRWIYDPQHKPELSGVTGRLAMGYEPVRWKDLEGSGLPIPPGSETDSPVRVADTVLMSIPSVLKREIERENAERAEDQRRSIDRTYYDGIEGLGSGLSEKHRPRAVGRSVIEEKEFSHEYEQKEGGTE